MTVTLPSEVSVPHFAGERTIRTIIKPVPQPGPGQLLIQVEANALCGSERGQFFYGTNVTPGHEAIGTVVAVGADTSVPIGTRGAVFLMDFCGACRSCRLGYTNQCLAKRADMGFNQDGGYGVYELISERIFFPIDPTLPAAEATLLLDIMGTGGHALRRAQLVHPDIESLIVAGAGPIGLGVLAMAKLLLGERLPVYLYDVNTYRLKLAEALGGKPISIADGKTVADGLRHHGAGTIDIAVDTSGKQAAREAGLSVLGQRGALVLVGHGEDLRLDVSRDMIGPERAVLGSEYFAFAELAGNAVLLEKHRTYLSTIITHRFGIAEIQRAFELFFDGQTGKVIIEH
jgi:threonine dehydrogenase-like Zn-dependent dehydrogenase